MAASTASLELRNDTNANFRLWGNFISTGLAAGGWTKLDTDITWASVSAPAQNTFAGYEVWQSPTEVGLTTFYLKIRYGSHNNATVGPAIETTLGWGYSGSGSSLSGVVGTARSTLAGSAAAVATARTCTIAAGAGYVVINLGNGSATVCGHLIVIERTRDSSLNKQDILKHVGQYWTTVLASWNQVLSTTYEYPVETSNNAAFTQIVTIGNSIAFGRVGLMWSNSYAGPITSPSEKWLGCVAGALGLAGQTVVIPVYGVDRTFFILTAASSSIGSFAALSTVNSLLLYE